MIVVDGDGVDERVDQLATTVRIGDVGIGEAVEEEKDAVAGDQLALGVGLGGDGFPELLGLIGKGLKEDGRLRAPDPFRNGCVDIINFPVYIVQILLHLRKGRGFFIFRLGRHDRVGDAADLRLREGMAEEKVDDGVFHGLLADRFFVAGAVGLAALAGIIVIGGAGGRGSGIADHGQAAMPAEELPGEQEIRGVILMVAGGFGEHLLGLLP